MDERSQRSHPDGGWLRRHRLRCIRRMVYMGAHQRPGEEDGHDVVEGYKAGHCSAVRHKTL